MRPDVAAQREDRAEVHLQHRVPVRGREFVRWVPSLDPAAVEQDADAVAVCEDGGDEGAEGGGGGEVCGVDGGFAAEGLDGGFGGLVRGVALDK